MDNYFITQILFILSAICFAADALKDMPRINLLSAGLCLFTITIAMA